MLALGVANSPLADGYRSLLEARLVVGPGAAALTKPVWVWINDGLMAAFFLLIGLELKRELRDGHLSTLRSLALPGFAAVGGMVVPALVYAALSAGDPIASRGWAIPAATDIAFALAVLSLVGPRVPTALKALLLSVAIFDDLGAILIIAIFYTTTISAAALAAAGILTLMLVGLNRAGVRRVLPYLALGVPLWYAVLQSGLHATLAGVVLALTIPHFGAGAGAAPERDSPLLRLEDGLHPWVAFGVLPIFAFANAGVSLTGLGLSDLTRPVPLGIAAGLVVGKQVGILGFAWLAVRLRVAELTAGLTWRDVHGVSLLCGIGFTMSLFVATLAFGPESLAPPGIDRLGILGGSLIAGLGGYLVLRGRAPSEAG